MTAILPPDIHDADTLAAARRLLDAAAGPRQMQQEVLAAVARNEQWRGHECINLLAPEALMSPTVRQLLSAEVGQRAAEGHIGPVNRWFAGTKHIDEIVAAATAQDLKTTAERVRENWLSLGTLIDRSFE